MSPENVTSLAKAAFRKRLLALAAQQNIADADFADAVYVAASQFAVNEDKFRAAFGLTKGATDRWTQGQNLPQPIARAPILLWISESL